MCSPHQDQCPILQQWKRQWLSLIQCQSFQSFQPQKDWKCNFPTRTSVLFGNRTVSLPSPYRMLIVEQRTLITSVPCCQEELHSLHWSEHKFLFLFIFFFLLTEHYSSCPEHFSLFFVRAWEPDRMTVVALSPLPRHKPPPFNIYLSNGVFTLALDEWWKFLWAKLRLQSRLKVPEHSLCLLGARNHFFDYLLWPRFTLLFNTDCSYQNTDLVKKI